MKNLFFIFAICACIAACSGSKKNSETDVENNPKDTVKIANDSLDYELIIFEPGFDAWLTKQQPRGYHSQNYLERKNRDFILTFNNRVLNTPHNSSNLYAFEINYDYTIDYGYELNYMLYNYFLFFQETNNQKL